MLTVWLSHLSDLCCPCYIPTIKALSLSVRYQEGLIKLDKIEGIEAEERPAFDIDDFDLDLGDGVLHPILGSPESSLNVADRRAHAGDDPTGTSLALLVNKDIPLNEKKATRRGKSAFGRVS